MSSGVQCMVTEPAYGLAWPKGERNLMVVSVGTGSAPGSGQSADDPELNAVAAHLPRVVCINRGIVADGPPAEIFTTDVLRRTYGGDMVVVKQDGMTLVADSPHFFDTTPSESSQVPV